MLFPDQSPPNGKLYVDTPPSSPRLNVEIMRGPEVTARQGPRKGCLHLSRGQRREDGGLVLSHANPHTTNMGAHTKLTQDVAFASHSVPRRYVPSHCFGKPTSETHVSIYRSSSLSRRVVLPMMFFTFEYRSKISRWSEPHLRPIKQLMQWMASPPSSLPPHPEVQEKMPARKATGQLSAGGQ